MRTRTQLMLLESLRRRKGIQKGFTLIELMIVVAIIGILSAVAIPKYLEARKIAAANAAIGEQVGLAKECASFIVSQVGSSPNTSLCTLTGGGTYSKSWSDIGSANNLKCLTSTGNGSKVTVGVSTVGDLTCTIA